ncbi:MAG: FliH/SctL family protein [bacterium]
MPPLSARRVLRAPDLTETATFVVVPNESTVPSMHIPSAANNLAVTVVRAAQDPLADIKLQAQHLRDAAEREAAAILAKARGEADGLVASAEKRGYDDGLRSARAELQGEIGQLVERLRSDVDHINGLRENLTVELFEETLALARAMATRILRDELTRDPAKLAAMVAPVLEPLKPIEAITLRVCPTEASWIEAGCAALSARLDGAQVHLVPDPRLGPGGLQCVYLGGEVELSLDQQLARLDAALRAQQVRESTQA